jgi:hypothetical protein
LQILVNQVNRFFHPNIWRRVMVLCTQKCT